MTAVQTLILHYADNDAPDEIIVRTEPMTDREFELWSAGVSDGACAAARIFGHPNAFIDTITDPHP